MPRTGWDIGQCLMRSVYFDMDESTCDFQLDQDTAANAMLRSISDRVPVYWLHEDFCPNGICDVFQYDRFIYMDFGHLSNEGSAYLGQTRNWMARFREMAR
jgi:hypothetical protein